VSVSVALVNVIHARNWCTNVLTRYVPAMPSSDEKRHPLHLYIHYKYPHRTWPRIGHPNKVFDVASSLSPPGADLEWCCSCMLPCPLFITSYAVVSDARYISVPCTVTHAHNHRERKKKEWRIRCEEKVSFVAAPHQNVVFVCRANFWKRVEEEVNLMRWLCVSPTFEPRDRVSLTILWILHHFEGNPTLYLEFFTVNNSVWVCRT